MKGYAIKVRDNLINRLWRGTRESLGEDGLDEDVLVIEEEHLGNSSAKRLSES